LALPVRSLSEKWTRRQQHRSGDKKLTHRVYLGREIVVGLLRGGGVVLVEILSDLRGESLKARARYARAKGAQFGPLEMAGDADAHRAQHHEEDRDALRKQEGGFDFGH